jgi:hypothetical protein
MLARAKYLPIVILGMAVSAHAQLSQDTRFAIIGSLQATEVPRESPCRWEKTALNFPRTGSSVATNSKRSLRRTASNPSR